jgi:hypothetical protein
MRKSIALFFSMLLLLATISFAQTNTWIAGSWHNTILKNAQGETTGLHVYGQFRLDSLGVVLLSPTIDLSEFVGVDMTTTPAVFRVNIHSTATAADTALTRIRVLSCFGNSSTDTNTVLDTLRNLWTTTSTATTVPTGCVHAVDTTGTLTFNGKIAPMVRLSLQALRRDVGTSYIDVVFRKPTH